MLKIVKSCWEFRGMPPLSEASNPGRLPSEGDPAATESLCCCSAVPILVQHMQDTTYYTPCLWQCWLCHGARLSVPGTEAMRMYKIINGLLNQPRKDAWKPNTRPPKGQPGKDSPSYSNRQLAKQTVPHTGYWCLKSTDLGVLFQGTRE